MRDGTLRRAAKAVALLTYRLNRLSVRGRRAAAPFVLAGVCARTGQCCEQPAIRVFLGVFALWPLRAPFLFWQRHVNGFTLVGEDRAARLFRFRCNHFDRDTRACDSYRSRPGMCRDYPRGLLASSEPELFADCGYRLVARNATGLLRELSGRHITGERLDKLKRGLHLE